MSNILISLLTLIAILFCWKSLYQNPARQIAGRKFYITKEYPTTYANAVDNLDHATIQFKKDGSIKYEVINDYSNDKWTINGHKVEMGNIADPDCTYIDLNDERQIDGHTFYEIKFEDDINIFQYFLVSEN